MVPRLTEVFKGNTFDERAFLAKWGRPILERLVKQIDKVLYSESNRDSLDYEFGGHDPHSYDLLYTNHPCLDDVFDRGPSLPPLYRGIAVDENLGRKGQTVTLHDRRGLSSFTSEYDVTTRFADLGSEYEGPGDTTEKKFGYILQYVSGGVPVIVPPEKTVEWFREILKERLNEWSHYNWADQNEYLLAGKNIKVKILEKELLDKLRGDEHWRVRDYANGP
jgi:hypothetical protein